MLTVYFVSCVGPRVTYCLSNHVGSSECHNVSFCRGWTTNLLSIQGREQVFPTRQSLGLMKSKLKGAEIGHNLLKRKSEALTKYVTLLFDPNFLANACCNLQAFSR